MTYHSFNARLSLAPMLDLTDRHFRYICRKLSSEMLLYTEMISTGAILYGKSDYLSYKTIEHPIALQLGGGDPKVLSQCARLAMDRNYDEINLNAGCPSDKVQMGSFGAILMRTPNLVAECVDAMKDSVDIPVTVKTRLGVDELNSYEYVRDYIGLLHEHRVDAVIIHARQAFLNGMSPRENRDIPELKYDWVYKLKEEFKDLPIFINGNIDTLNEVKEHLKYVDGVMMGRSLYQNPYMLVDADSEIFGKVNKNKISRKDFIRSLYPYIEEHIANGGFLKHISRHLLGMFTGCPNARAYRAHLSKNHFKENANINVLEEAMDLVGEVVEDTNTTSLDAK